MATISQMTNLFLHFQQQFSEIEFKAVNKRLPPLTCLGNLFYIKLIILGKIIYKVSIMESNATYFSYIVVVSIIGGGKQSTQRKPCAPTCHKSLTSTVIIQLHHPSKMATISQMANIFLHFQQQFSEIEFKAF
jgi:hypothetical protein